MEEEEGVMGEAKGCDADGKMKVDRG